MRMGSGAITPLLILLLLALTCWLVLRRPPQHKLVWVWGESLDHSEDAGTEAKARLCIGIELGKALSVQEEIGIPEVRVNQGIKVDMEASAPLTSGRQREIERILGSH